MAKKNEPLTLETPVCGTFKINFLHKPGKSISLSFDYMPIGGYAVHAFIRLYGRMPKGDVLNAFRLIMADMKKRRLAFEAIEGEFRTCE